MLIGLGLPPLCPLFLPCLPLSFHLPTLPQLDKRRHTYPYPYPYT